jgi:hypothetical protein
LAVISYLYGFKSNVALDGSNPLLKQILAQILAQFSVWRKNLGAMAFDNCQQKNNVAHHSSFN